MSNETLELSEHELYFLPPGTPATAPATRVEVEVEGEMRVFLARLEWQYQNVDDRDIYFVFYRDEDAEDARFLSYADCITALKSVSSQEETENWFRRSIQRRANRFWHPKNADFGIIFSFDFAYVEWRREKRLPEYIGFTWKLPFGVERLEDWSQSDFLKFCEQLYADEDSELNFALRWHEKSSEAKDIEAFKCENGDWENLRNLLACVQKLVTHQYGVFNSPSSGFSQWSFTRDWLKNTNGVEPCLGAMARAARWRDTICEIVRPSFWKEEPTCVRKQRISSPQNVSRCQIRCGIPTHHEFLEAQLELREFLRPHLTDDEIEALMRPEPIA